MKYLKNIVGAAPELLLNDNSRLLVSNFNAKELKLWNGIISGKIRSNHQASDLIYGVVPSSQTFQKFKQTFKSKLDNIILLYKNAGGSKFQISYHLALKEQLIIKVLINLGYRSHAMARAKTLIRNCEKFEFNGIGEDICKLLWKNSAVFEGDMDAYQRYVEIYNSFREMVDHEVKAEQYYAEVVNYYTHKKALSSEVSEKALFYYEELKKYKPYIKSYRFHIDYFRLGIIGFESIGDFRSCLKMCQDAVDHFDNLAYHHNGAIQIFKRKMVNYQLQLNQLLEAEKLIQNLIEINPEKNHIWFLNQEQIFLIKMRSNRYEEAQLLHKYVCSQKRFSSESEEVKDKWTLYNIYIGLLGYMGVLGSSPKPAKIISQISQLNRFRGDKMGMNLALLICQTIYVYYSGNTDHLNIHIDAIKKYSSTYLKSGNERSKIFLKMLCQLPLIGFEDKKFQRNIKYLREKLNEKRIENVAQAIDIEVIPYENLWTLVLAKDDKSRNVISNSSTDSITA